MKGMVLSGKIKGTDALKILRKAKNESEFIMYAHELSENKVDLRKRDEYNIQEPQKQESGRKAKVKQLIIELLGKDRTMEKTSTINSLVDQLMAS